MNKKRTDNQSLCVFKCEFSVNFIANRVANSAVI
jgi:hypothetical protein